MADTAMTIGDRLRKLRGERALTQEMLAELARVSVDLIKKLEQGKRDSARLTTLVALADALDVPLSRLMDRRPRLDGGADRLVLGLRDALLSLDVLPGFDAADDTGEPTPAIDVRLAQTGLSDAARPTIVAAQRRCPKRERPPPPVLLPPRFALLPHGQHRPRYHGR